MQTVTPQLIDLEERQAEAFNSGKVNKLLDFFYPDIVGFSSTKYERISGLDAMQATFDFYLHEADKMEYHLSEPTVQAFGDTAITTFYWTVNLTQNGHSQEIKGRGSHVYAKMDGEWKIVHEHFSRAHHHVEK